MDNYAYKSQQQPRNHQLKIVGRNNLAHALEYADRDWRVLPLHNMVDGKCSCRSVRCKAGKHPRIGSWQRLATTDQTIIKNWWRNWPGANVGIVCDNLTVIDVDPRNGGCLQDVFDVYDGLEAIFEAAYTVKTGDQSGEGRHYYFNGTGSLTKALKGKHGLGDGIEVLTRNNYVVAPPSNHIHGTHYELLNDTLTKFPPILNEIINTQLEIADNEIPEGRRNIELTRIAGQISRETSNFSKLKQRLHSINDARCNLPLEFEEVEGIAESVHRMALGSSSASKKTKWQNEIIGVNLPIPCRFVLMGLASYANAAGEDCFPSQKTLANKLRVTEKTVGKYLKVAVDRKCISRFKMGKDGQGWHYGYRLLYPLPPSLFSTD